MPTGPADDEGTVLYYVDSGPLEGPYVTLIVVPGIGYLGPGKRD
jgi:hypothetical protein